MKKIVLLGLVLLLSSCGQEDLKQELAASQNKNETLTTEKQQIQEKLDQTTTELEGLRKASGDAESLKQEMDGLRTKAAEVDALQKKLADSSKLNQKVQDLEKKLNDVGKDTQKLAFLANQMKGIKATIVTNMGEINLTFFPDLAPIHCFNFITRAESGFYNKTQFHRVIPGFMIQGGDPNSRDMNFMDDGSGTTVDPIPHEFNSKHHARGILSMARQSNVQVGAGSQFFIMHGDAPQLDNQYTVFGEVTSGMDVVDKIATTQRDRRDHPVNPAWIETIKVFR